MKLALDHHPTLVNNQTSYYLNKNNELILYNNFFQDIYGKNLPIYEIRKKILLLLEEYGEEVTINLTSENNTVGIQALNNILLKNHPLLAISRLKKGDSIVNFRNKQIKKINDSLGEKKPIDNCVQYIQEQLSHYIQWRSGATARTIKQGYKDLTLSYNTGHLHFTPENLNINEDFLINTLQKLPPEYKILNEEKHNLMVSLFVEYFQIEVGNSQVEGESNEKKSLAIYEAEKSGEMPDSKFNFQELKNKSSEVFQIENNILHKYKNQTFILNGEDFPLIVKNIDPEKNFGGINPELIGAVKKGEYIGDDTLTNDILEYISSLNIFDFIATYITPEGNEKQPYTNIKKIESFLKDGKVEGKNIQNNYKGTLDRTALHTKCEGKKGVRVFLDIAEMGILNLSEFRQLAKKVHNGEITEKNKSELLKAGMKTTLKFIHFIESLQTKYPDSSISLGGDEVFIFFPDTDEKNEETIFKSIQENLYKQGLSARSSHSHNITSQSQLFDQLDTIASQSAKSFEKIFRMFNRRNKDEKSTLSQVLISDSIRTFIISESPHYEKQFSQYVKKHKNTILKSNIPIHKNTLKIYGERRQEVHHIIDNTPPLVFTYRDENGTSTEHKIFINMENSKTEIRVE